jgi:hypothetical protein
MKSWLGIVLKSNDKALAKTVISAGTTAKDVGDMPYVDAIP